MKKLCLLLLLLSFFKANSQMEDILKPDYNRIEKNSRDKSSPYHYGKLFERYMRADSTMTLEEKRHLYYGYSFQDGYSLNGEPEARKKLSELLQKNNADREDLESVLKYTSEILLDYPFSLRMKEYRIYCFKQLERFNDANRETLQMAMIIDAILSTGDGTTKERCFYVINTINEYELLHILGFEYGGRQHLIDNRYNYLTLHGNSYNLDGLYFEVSRSPEKLKLK